jgi:hypothetical protein
MFLVQDILREFTEFTTWRNVFAGSISAAALLDGPGQAYSDRRVRYGPSLRDVTLGRPKFVNSLWRDWLDQLHWNSRSRTNNIGPGGQGYWVRPDAAADTRM